MVSCKKCGKKGLAWRETLSGFKLCDNFGMHQCDQDLTKKSKRRKAKNLKP